MDWSQAYLSGFYQVVNTCAMGPVEVGGVTLGEPFVAELGRFHGGYWFLFSS